MNSPRTPPTTPRPSTCPDAPTKIHVCFETMTPDEFTHPPQSPEPTPRNMVCPGAPVKQYVSIRHFDVADYAASPARVQWTTESLSSPVREKIPVVVPGAPAKKQRV